MDENELSEREKPNMRFLLNLNFRNPTQIYAKSSRNTSGTVALRSSRREARNLSLVFAKFSTDSCAIQSFAFSPEYHGAWSHLYVSTSIDSLPTLHPPS